MMKLGEKSQYLQAIIGSKTYHSIYFLGWWRSIYI